MLVHQPVITSQSEIAIVPAGGSKRTLRGHSLMSPFDPTATSAERPQLSFPTGIDAEVQMSDSLIVGRVNRAVRTILEARRTGALLDTLAPIDQPQSDIGPRPQHVPFTLEGGHRNRDVYGCKAFIERVQRVQAEKPLSLRARSAGIHRYVDHVPAGRERYGPVPFVCRIWDTTDKRSRLANSQHSQPFFPPHATIWPSAAD